MTDTASPSDAASEDGRSVATGGKGALLCLIISASLLCLSIGYAFDLAAPLLTALAWAAEYPTSAAMCVFAVMFFGGFVIQNASVAGIGAVGFLVMYAGVYMVSGWFSFLTTGLTSEGVPITMVSPLAAALVLSSAVALICCVVGHGEGLNRIEKAMLATGMALIVSFFFYWVLDDYSSSRHASPVSEPVLVHPDHLAHLSPEDCVYEDDGFIRCRIAAPGAP